MVLWSDFCGFIFVMTCPHLIVPPRLSIDKLSQLTVAAWLEIFWTFLAP